jgi:hypothetical protein
MKIWGTGLNKQQEMLADNTHKKSFQPTTNALTEFKR